MGELPLEFTGRRTVASSTARRLTLPIAMAAAATLAGGVWAFAEFAGPSPVGPAIEVEVGGMHCPVQCGLRVATALERLPWVAKRSVLANPGKERIWLRVTDPASVDPEAIREAVRKSGFRPGSVTILNVHTTEE